MPDPYREPVEDKPEAVKELERLSSVPEVKEQAKTPETPSPAPVQEQTQISSPSVSSSPPSAATIPQDTAGSDLENDRQLKLLVDMAFEKGIDEAIKAVRATESPYLIDKFHDTLVDELRQKLVEKGKLKEI